MLATGFDLELTDDLPWVPDWNLPVEINRDLAAELGVVWAMAPIAGSRKVFDLTGNANHGDLQPYTGTAPLNAPTWVQDPWGGPALQLDASDDYVDLGTGFNVSGAYTFSARFRATTFPNGVSPNEGRWIFGKDTNTGRSYDFGFWYDTGTVRLCAQINGTNVPLVGGGPGLGLNTDYDAAWAWNGSNLSYYLNGELVSGPHAASAPASTSTPLYLGGRAYPGYFNGHGGLISHAVICSKALTVQQIEARYRQPYLLFWQPGSRTIFDFVAGGSPILADVPIGAIETAGVVPASTKAAPAPIGLHELLAPTLSAQKLAPLTPAAVDHVALTPTTTKAAAVSPATIETASIVPTSQKTATLAPAVIEVAALTPIGSRSAAIAPGVVAFVGVSLDGSAAHATPIGEVAYAGVTPAGHKQAALSVGVIDTNGLAPSSVKLASVPIGSWATEGVTPGTTKLAQLSAAIVATIANVPSAAKLAALVHGVIDYVGLVPHRAGDEDNIVSGPFYVMASQWFVPGSTNGQSHSPGSTDGQTHSPGSQRGQYL